MTVADQALLFRTRVKERWLDAMVGFGQGCVLSFLGHVQ